MPRLGELLVAAGALGEAQLEEGLRSQVIHGARLGTNVVELELCKLDDVAVALARQHGIPPALARHFERCDVDVPERLPGALASAHQVVPIGYLASEQARVMVACRDPLTDIARRELEVAMGLGKGGVVLAIAAELRILYYLERVYAIPRANRFLRVRRSTTVSSGPPAFEAPRDDWGDATGAGSSAGTGEFTREEIQYRAFEDGTDPTDDGPPGPPAA